MSRNNRKTELDIIVQKIIALGESHNWYIPMVTLPYSEYIFHDDNFTITLKTNCIRLFIATTKSFSDTELIKYLKEMIYFEIPEIKDYKLIIINSSKFD